VKKGYKQTEVGVIPDDWEVNKIETLTPQNKKYGIVDGPFGSNLKTIHYRKSGIPIITSGYVTEGQFIAKEYLFVDLEKFKQEKRSAVNAGDIVMAKIGARCGASAILPANHPEGILSGNALKISIDEKQFSTYFIWQVLWNLYVKGDLELLRTVGAQPAISMANLKKYQIPLPPTKAEQTAIAAALSDADALIQSLEKLIAKKRNIKQGAMQELLKPKEGWVVRKLGEIAKTIASGKSNTKSNIGNYPIYGSTGIIGWNKSFDYEGHSILVARVGANAGTINIADGKYNVSDNTLMISFSGNVDIFFLFYKLNDCQLHTLVFGSGQPLITGSQLKSLEMAIPSNIPEQTRIATILSDMDAEISALETKLAKYKQVKQGMMQELLTGRIRLV